MAGGANTGQTRTDDEYIDMIGHRRWDLFLVAGDPVAMTVPDPMRDIAVNLHL